MRSQFNSVSRFPGVLLVLVLAGSIIGCAKDGNRSPLGELFEPPSLGNSNETMPIARDALRPALRPAAQSTIRQTSFNAAVAEPVWHDSLESAISEAQTNNKLILADFTGSDWCHYCVKLKKEIFETPEFKSWASENVALLEVDFPRQTQLPLHIQRQNEMMKSRYGISSYPTVLLLDIEGNVKAKMAYQKGQSPAAWVQMAEARLQQNASGASRYAQGQNGSQLR